MQLTISISHTFTDVVALQAFLADFAPITAKYSDAPRAIGMPYGSDLNSATAAPAHDVKGSAFTEARAVAETINQPVAERVPTVEASKRKRRTNAEIATDNAADGLEAGAVLVAAETAPAAPVVAAPAQPAPAPKSLTLDDVKNAFMACVKLCEASKPGSSRALMSTALQRLGVAKFGDLTEGRFADAIEVLNATVASLVAP